MKESVIASLSAAALVVGGGAYAAWHYNDTERAKRDVQERLVDPASAIFSNIERCNDEAGKLIYVTGLVNSRNSMGGMTGKRRFLASAIDNEFITAIETEDSSGNPNLADKFAKAHLYAQSHPMTCQRVEEVAMADTAEDARLDSMADDLTRSLVNY